ncbi:MAG: Cna B-type domain-containing protein [Clostridiales bacterium]|nr:Cna B-type domain-containing protein [Clostridiales bacterium]
MKHIFRSKKAVGITSLVLATSVVLGTIAINRKKDGGVSVGIPTVNAADAYLSHDSASLVNYSSVLGRAVDFGIVTNRLEQRNHMETTYATNDFYNQKNDNCDVDLAGAAPAQFIIASISGGKARFGYTYGAKNDYQTAPSMQFVIDTTPDLASSDLFTYDAGSFKGEALYRTFSEPELNSNVNGMIQHFKDESDKMLQHVAFEGDDVFDASTGAIDFSDECYKNTTLYINVQPGSRLESAIQATEGLNIIKDPSTVVVFNILNTDYIKLAKYKVTSDNMTMDTYTDHSGDDTEKNKNIDKYITRKIIWNVPYAKSVDYDTTAGLFLVPNPDTTGTVTTSSAGWIAAAGTTVVKGGEFHYIFHDRSDDANTPDISVMHFALRKAFVEDGTPADQIKSKEIRNILVGAGEYTFTIEETDENYNKLTDSNAYTDEKSTDAYGKVVFKSISETVREVDPYNGKHRYFVIKEKEMAPGVDSHISKSNGEIRIDVLVTNVNGIIHYQVSSWKYADGNNLTDSGIIATNDKIDMSGTEFSLGGFYNFYDLKYAKMSVTKNVNVTGTDDFPADQKFNFALKIDGKYVQNEQGELGLTPRYFEITRDQKIDFTHLIPGTYTIEENPDDIQGFTFLSKEVQVGSSAMANDQVVLGDDDDVAATLINNYQKVDIDGKFSLKVKKNVDVHFPPGMARDMSDFEGKEFRFTVKLGDQYVQDKNGTLGTSEKVFTINYDTSVQGPGAVGNEFTIYGLEPDATYTVTEVRDQNYTGDDAYVAMPGYTYTSNANETTKNVRLDQDGKRAEIVNKYDVQKGKLTVNKSFTLIDDNNANGSGSVDTATLSNLNNLKFTITGPLGYSKTLTYTDITEGRNVLNDVPAGKYTIIEENASETSGGNYTFVRYSYVGADSTTSVAAGGNQTITVYNQYRENYSTTEKGNITIAKSMDGAVAPDGSVFNFTIKNSLGEYCEFDAEGNFVDFTTTKTYASLTFPAGSGYYSSREFKNIPTGSYTVEEEPTDEQKTLEGKNLKVEYMVDGVSTQSFKLENYGNKQVQVNNHYREYMLEVEKLVSGDIPYDYSQYGMEYSFVVMKGTQYVQSNGGLSDNPYTFKIRPNQKMQIPISDPGDYQVIETTTEPENSLFTLATTYSTVNGEVTLDSTNKDGSVIIHNEYTYKNKGSLEVKKEVADPTNSAPAGTEFTVGVKLNRTGAFDVEYPDGTTQQVAFEKDVVKEFTLKSGESIKINGLYAGTEYEVTESNIPSGFSLATDGIVYGNTEKKITKDTEDLVTVNNTYDYQEYFSLSVEKNWDDGNDQDRKRPTEVVVILKQDGNEIDRATLKDSNNWTYTATNLPKYNGAAEYVYKWEEVPVADYTTTYSPAAPIPNGTTTITNSYTPETTTATVTKKWVDFNNAAGKRPTEIVMTLSNGDTVKLNAGNNWTATISGLPKYNNGVLINYTWTEGNMPQGYSQTDCTTLGTTTTIENTYDISLEKTTMKVTKVWDDANNQDGMRPLNLTVTLRRNNADFMTQTLNEANNWTVTLDNLAKFDDQGALYTYEWVEPAVTGYTSVSSGTVADRVFTNTHAPEKISLSVEKIWDDNNNQDGKRPTGVEVILKKDGQEIARTTLDDSNNWTYATPDMDKYEAGREIVYTWEEEAVAEYTPSESELNGVTTFKNTHVPETVSVSVEKTWDDNSDQDGIRPTSLNVVLLKNGADYEVIELNEGNSWSASRTGLPKYENGTLINYTWDEVTVPSGYNLVGNGLNAAGNTELINQHTAETVDLTVKKKWVNTGNSAAQPTSVVVDLLADGSPIDSVTLDAQNNWEHTFTGLDAYAAGKKIVYTFAEHAPANYDDTYETVGTVTTITNTYDFSVERTTATITKEWDDNNDQDGMRPLDLEVQLLQDGVAYRSPVKLEAASGWTYTATDLPKFDSVGHEYKYTWDEVTVPTGYSMTDNDTNGTDTTIRNEHTTETVSLTVTKDWIDNNDITGNRPSEIEVHLLVNGTAGKTITLKASENWTATETGLAKYSNGLEINYSWDEVVPTNYQETYIGNGTPDTVIQNAYDFDVERTTAKVTKVWDDNNNEEGLRPDDVEVQLLQNNSPYEASVKLEAASNWTYERTDLPKYDSVGNEYIYTWDEPNEPSGYNMTANNTNGTDTTIINGRTVEKTDLTVKKEWVNTGNSSAQPTSVVVDLLADGSPIDSVMLDASNNWAYTFSGLNVYAGGKKIVYTFKEQVPANYDDTYDTVGTVTTITNTYDFSVERTTAKITKEWDDNNDQDGKRPLDLEVQLYQDGVAYRSPVKLEAASGWTYTATDLPKYDAAGNEYKYTWNEVSVPAGYNMTANDTVGTDTTIRNGHTTETVSLTVTKDWIDNNDITGNRPTEIVVNLLVNGTAGKTITLKASENWTATETGLAKYSNGLEINYSWEEVVPTNYKVTYSGNGTADATITNTYDFDVERTTATVTKDWDDSNDQDGKRPDTLTVQLLQNDVAFGSSVVLKATENWTYTASDLPKYDSTGTEYRYTWEESSVPAEYSLIGNTTNGTNTTLINQHTTDTTELSVKKTWVNTGNSSAQPTSVVVDLVAGTTKVGSVTLSAANNWEDKISDLPVYENGAKINYEWKEQVPANYTDTYTGNGTASTTITNTYNFSVEETTAKVTKTWVDSNDQDGMRPLTLEVQLLQNDVACGAPVTLDEASGWTYEKTGLPKFDANGTAYRYTWEEVTVPAGYTLTGNTTNGTNTTLINQHTIEVTEATVKKEWINTGNSSAQPTSVVVDLLADGAVIDSVTLDASINWTYTYSNLDAYAGGQKIAYTFKEHAPANYNDTYETVGTVTTITNTYDFSVERTEATVTKNWIDSNDQDGMRPLTLEVQLLQDGVAFRSPVTLQASSNWTHTERDLPKYDVAGNEYKYTWTEVAEPSGYSMTGNTTTGTDTTITNAHTTETISLKVTKAWADNNDQTGNRPSEIQVKLLVNGTAGKTITLKASENWTATETGLAKYSNGLEINYSWEEVVPANYNVIYSGNGTADATITNTYDYTNETTTATVTKSWSDNNDQDGKRPTSVTVQLLRDGTACGNPVNLTAADSWTYTESNLEKYDTAGNEYKYTWEEVSVPAGYTMSGNVTSGTDTTITNAHTTETTSLVVKKTWVNTGNSSAQPASVDVDLYKGTTKIGTVTLDASNNWEESIGGLPVYENGTKITYEWKEIVPADYKVSYSGNGTASTTITNTFDHAVVKTEAKVTKVWSDNNDQDGKRPTEVKVQLKQNNVDYGAEVTLNAGNNWTYTKSQLPKFDDNGNEYTYTWDEVSVPSGYIKTVSGTGADTVITNTHTAETTTMTVKKTWVNTGNSAAQPASVVVDLMNGTTKVGSVTLSAANNWEDKISDLPVYTAGLKNNYEWQEQVPANYSATYTGNGTASTVVTNTYNFTAVKTTAKVTKVWDDDNDRDGKRPATLQVQLLQNGSALGSPVTLDAASGWTYEVTDLQKFDANGNAYSYTWEETSVPADYSQTGNSTSGTETTITNAHTVATTQLTVKKTWVNTGNSSAQPTSVVVDLMNGTTKVGSVTLDDSNNWEDSISNLPVNENGSAITYEWKEQVPTNYKESYSVSGTTTTITNIFDISSEKTEATVKKVWDDNNNQDGKRPTEVTVRLLRNGTPIGSDILLNDGNNWEYKAENLDKMDASGNAYTYSWEEDAVTDYSASKSESGTVTTFTNKHVPETKILTVEKIWDDANNVAGVRPTELVMTLSSGGSVTLNEQNGWTASVSVPVYANGAEIAYSWSEGTMPAGYTKESCVVSGNTTTFTNKFDLTTVKTSVSVAKVWDDNSDAAGARPTELIVSLSDGTQVVDQATLNDANGWKYTANDLAMYDANGNVITYTWSEGAMPAGYALTDTTVNAGITTFTNTYTAPVQVKGSLKIEKVLGPDAPASAATKAYHFTVTCPDGSTIPVEIVGASYVELNDLALGDYKITEDEADAKISGYDLSILNNDATVTLADATQKSVTVTNNYTQQQTTPAPTTPAPTTPAPTGSKTTQDASSESSTGTEPSEQPSETTATPTPTKEIENITIDDKPIKPEDYEKKPDGSIELKPETIDELTLGVHRMRITYTDGSTITVEFEVVSSATRPGGKTVVKTGDTGSSRPPFLAFLFIIVAAAALLILRKRTKKERQF